MFIVWRSGKDVVRAADAGEMQCGNCNRHCPHSILDIYSYTDFYWVLGIVTGHEYLLACDRCNAGMTVSHAEAKRHVSHVPIPFMRRFGCLVAVAGFAMFVVLASVMKK